MQSTAREISDSKTFNWPGYVECARALVTMLADSAQPGHGMPAWNDCLDHFAAPLWAPLAEMEATA